MLHGVGWCCVLHGAVDCGVDLTWLFVVCGDL